MPPAADKTAAPQQSTGQATATPSPALTGTPAAATVYGQSNHNARVVLKAKADTHITVRGQNGAVFINRNLKAGDSYQVPNQTGLTLSASNGGAIEMDLDGQAMGTAGSDQQNADGVSLDPQTLADRAGH